MAALPNAANELASTIQATHINPSPDPRHDMAPSTAASAKQPVQVQPLHASFPHQPPTHPSDVDDAVPSHYLRPLPRSHALPPLPDMRFEQSYLARIAHCDSAWSVAWTTLVDQALMPLSQGFVWNLAVFGWRAWNSGARLHGKGVGVSVRRWWWGVNGWDVPPAQKPVSRGLDRAEGKVQGLWERVRAVF